MVKLDSVNKLDEKVGKTFHHACLTHSDYTTVYSQEKECFDIRIADAFSITL